MSNNGQVITLSSLNSTGSKNPDSKEGHYNAGSGKLHTNHAYWIESVDAANDKIVVRNPWGYQTSKTHRIEMTFKEFEKSFDRIDTNTLSSK